jgi:hypothetical protein
MVPVIKRPRLIFRLALRRAIHIGWKRGKITSPEAYLLYDVLNGSKRGGRYYRRPELLMECEKACRKELVAHDPESAASGDVDWGHWIDLLVEWLPIIIKVILTLLVFVEPPANEPSESSKITIPPIGKPGESNV